MFTVSHTKIVHQVDELLLLFLFNLVILLNILCFNCLFLFLVLLTESLLSTVRLLHQLFDKFALWVCFLGRSSLDNHGLFWYLSLFQLLVLNWSSLGHRLSSQDFLHLLILSICWLWHSCNTFWVPLQQRICFLVGAQDNTSSAGEVRLEVVWSLVHFVWVRLEPYLVSAIQSLMTTESLLV